MMSTITLTKHHGLGNDFLVLADVDGALDVSLAEGDALAHHLCDRHRGIGADGLLLALPAPEDGSAAVTMRLHNAGGGVAEMSGNGIRCFAQAVVDGGLVPAGTLRVATDAGLRVVEVGPSDAHGLADIRVGMGVAKLDSIPLGTIAGAGRVRTVDVGNPHVVIEGDPQSVDLAVLGPEVEAPYLASSGGINVEVIASASRGPRGIDAIDMVVWERGVGITQACGTGATAAALVAHRWGLVGHIVEVRQPGGSSVVEIAGDAEVDGETAGDTAVLTLVGPSQFIARIEVPRRLVDSIIGRA